MFKRWVLTGAIAINVLFIGYIWIFEPDQGRCAFAFLVDPEALSYQCRGAMPEETLIEWRAVEYARHKRRGVCP